MKVTTNYLREIIKESLDEIMQAHPGYMAGNDELSSNADDLERAPGPIGEADEIRIHLSKAIGVLNRNINKPSKPGSPDMQNYKKAKDFIEQAMKILSQYHRQEELPIYNKQP